MHCICGTELTGRQRKYCSALCRGRAYNQARGTDGRLREYRSRESTRQRNRARLRQAAGQGRYTQTFTCEKCGTEHTNRRGEQARFCSWLCAQPTRDKPTTEPKQPVDLRSALRRAWEAGDWPAVMEELLKRTHPGSDGCRIWTGQKNRDGYSQVLIGRKRYSTYRVMASAMIGTDLGPSPVHHTCAQRLCIEPTHLQVIDAISNVAEMLHRQSYLKRIAALEEALAELDPDHPLLDARRSIAS